MRSRMLVRACVAHASSIASVIERAMLSCFSATIFVAPVARSLPLNDLTRGDGGGGATATSDSLRGTGTLEFLRAEPLRAVCESNGLLLALLALVGFGGSPTPPDAVGLRTRGFRLAFDLRWGDAPLLARILRPTGDKGARAREPLPAKGKALASIALWCSLIGFNGATDVMAQSCRLIT